jgi:hypothetical protein
MGTLKAKEPMIPKEAIRPAIVVPAATDPSTLGPLANNGAQATTQLPSASGSGHLPGEDLHLSVPTGSQAHWERLPSRDCTQVPQSKGQPFIL